jgi:hypothetical protein
MKLRHLYFTLFLLGTLVPYAQILPWLRRNGLDLPLLLRELFATPVSAFFGWDVIVAAVALLVFVVVETRRRRIALGWIAIPATLLIGVSAGLPLFLYLRQRQRDASARVTAE